MKSISGSVAVWSRLSPKGPLTSSLDPVYSSISAPAPRAGLGFREAVSPLNARSKRLKLSSEDERLLNCAAVSDYAVTENRVELTRSITAGYQSRRPTNFSAK